jgi:adenine-specific DNA-methyltransferase
MNELEVKQAIAEALKAFGTLPLAEVASGLLEVLGYTSKKRLRLKPNTLTTFLATFSHGRALNERIALPTEWKSVDFLFQLTDDEVRTAANQQFNFASGGAFNGAIINSYLFIAIELKGNHYSRSALAGITREVNKLFDMPVLILFRHGDSLTLAVINRRLHKKELDKDVLEKVTLIQDIQIANTHRAHIDILSDLSLGALHEKHPFSNFVGLHEAWQRTLDTSELNKRFFQDLANWYFVSAI